MVQAWKNKDPSRDACLPSLDPDRVFSGQSFFLYQAGFFFNLFYSYSQGKRNKTLNLCFLNFTVLKVQTITIHMKHDISLGISKCHTPEHTFCGISYIPEGAAFNPARASLVAQTVKNRLQFRRPGFYPWVGKIPWRRKWQPTQVFLPGEFHGQRAWWATTHGVTKSQTQLSDFHFT